MPAEAQTLSFVIPVRNAARHLSRCLRSIEAAGAGLGEWEVVVVDNGSTDDSVAIARQHGARVVSAPSQRVGAVRNAGARATSAAILAFVDADHEISAGWIASCRAALMKPRVGAAGCQYDAPRPGTWVQRAYDCLRVRPAAPRVTSWLGAGNLAVWRHVFDQAGGFDESLEACEDVDLCRAIRQRGFQIVSEPGMHSIHHGDPATLGDVLRGELWRGRSNLRVTLREHLTVRSLASAFAPLAVLVLLVSALAAIASMSWVGPWPAIVATGAAAAVVLLRTAVMIRRGTVRSAADALGCFVVAATYECGRALSPIVRATHTSRARDAA